MIHSEQHVGGSYAGHDENEAQRQAGAMFAHYAIQQITAQERADRIREIGVEQARLLGWRQPQQIGRKRGCMNLWPMVAFGVALYALWTVIA